MLPLFTLFGPDALAYRLADAKARIVVTDGASLEKLDEIRGGVAGPQVCLLHRPVVGT